MADFGRKEEISGFCLDSGCRPQRMPVLWIHSYVPRVDYFLLRLQGRENNNATSNGPS